ncbi:hypothetical protein ISS30_05330 [bacterium]|nr:hypothetical protein [bacterium]
MSGADFYTDEKCRKTRSHGYLFYGGGTFHVPSLSPDRQPDGIPRDTLPARGSLKCQILRDSDKIEVPFYDNFGPQGAFSNEKGVYCFEFKIPYNIG